MAKERKVVHDNCTMVNNTSSRSIPPLESEETLGTEGSNFNDKPNNVAFMRT